MSAFITDHHVTFGYERPDVGIRAELFLEPQPFTLAQEARDVATSRCNSVSPKHHLKVPRVVRDLVRLVPAVLKLRQVLVEQDTLLVGR